MNQFGILIAASALATIASPAISQQLLNETNFPTQSNTPVSLNFTAGAPTTTIDFAGYQVPSDFYVSDISLIMSGGSTNLLGSTFNFTAAPSGTDSSQGPLGAYGTNDLRFAGTTEGSYDQYAQDVSTSVGDNYTLSFSLSNAGDNAPSGFIVSASDAITGAVPEPATWAMMLIGFGGIGLAMRRRKTQIAQIA